MVSDEAKPSVSRNISVLHLSMVGLWGEIDWDEDPKLDWF